MAAGEGELSEAELLAILRGINSDSIKEKTQKELDEKYGKHVSSVEAMRRAGGEKNNNENADNDGSKKKDADWTTPEGFLAAAPEIAGMNQYWYSLPTIKKMVSIIREAGKTEDGSPMKIAFISTPSLFFSLSEEERKECVVLDYDKQWETEHGFHFYDFNDPEGVADSLKGQFDLVVIDPPFIQEECWRQYGVTSNLLLRKPPAQASENETEFLGGRAVLTTIIENEDLLFELFNAKPNVFRPSIPNLVYQYHIFTNFNAPDLSMMNDEVGC
jgi:hypothetical protein